MFNILDLFCGTGALSFGLRAFDGRFNVVGGIDTDRSACATAHANHPNGTFVCAPIEQLTPRRFQDIIGSSTIDMIVGGPPAKAFHHFGPIGNRISTIPGIGYTSISLTTSVSFSQQSFLWRMLLA